MKTKFFDVLAAAVLIAATLLAAGCGGVRHAALKIGNDAPITHDDSNYSLLQPSVGPVEMAEAYRIKKQADSYEKMMTGLQDGKTVAAANGKFIIGLVNNDPFRSVYFFHPEKPGLKLAANPKGGFQLCEVRDIPYEIVLYDTADKIIKKIKPRYEPDYQENVAHKKLVGNVLVDLRIKINRVN